MMNRLPSEWRNFCIYSGRHLPDAALTYEHVIPKSCGGNRSTIIPAARELNSKFGSAIDGPISNDAMVQFGRRDAKARGHSGKRPVATINGARAWKRGEPWGEGETRYRLEIPKEGPPKIFDTKSRTFSPPSVLADTGFVVPNWRIDHVARLRFTIKTLLGVGWKFFQTDLLAAIDVDQLRALLTASLGLSPEPGKVKIGYANPFLVKPEDREVHPLTKIEPALIRKGETAILMREYDDTFEWSIACFGYLIGSIWVPLRAPLLKGDIRSKGGLRLVVRRDSLERQPVAPIE
jgi:hypothetical protein